MRAIIQLGTLGGASRALEVRLNLRVFRPILTEGAEKNPGTASTHVLWSVLDKGTGAIWA